MCLQATVPCRGGQLVDALHVCVHIFIHTRIRHGAGGDASARGSCAARCAGRGPHSVDDTGRCVSLGDSKTLFFIIFINVKVFNIKPDLYCTLGVSLKLPNPPLRCQHSRRSSFWSRRAGLRATLRDKNKETAHEAAITWITQAHVKFHAKYPKYH